MENKVAFRPTTTYVQQMSEKSIVVLNFMARFEHENKLKTLKIIRNNIVLKK